MSDGKEQPRVFYRIKDWNVLFENNRTRELKYLEWVAFPNPMLIGGGDAYAELMEHPDGPTHFAVFCACVFLASRSHLRGTLLRSGVAPSCDPMSQARVAHTCRIPADKCGIALDRLVELGWIECLPLSKLSTYNGAGKSRQDAGKSHENAGKSHEDASARARVARVPERNGTEYNTPPLPPSTEGGGPSHLTRSEKKRLEQERQTRLREQADALRVERSKQVS